MNDPALRAHAQFSTSHYLRPISREWEGGVGMMTWMAHHTLTSDVPEVRETVHVLAAELKRHGDVPRLCP